MTRFAVWAPRPQAVELELDGRRHSMSPASAPGTTPGWWEAHADAAPGSRYGFVLDGSPVALPDPRSPWQPDGPHGLSAVVDHSAFTWTDGGWQPPAWEQAVVYELHVGTFSPEGTYEGVAARLDHLVDLGVTHLELMPVATFAGHHGWGYDGVDLFAPHPAYGPPDALRRLVDACHARGLAVMLDVVHNHFGPEGNHLERFGPYLTDRYHTPWGGAVNLDRWGRDEVRRFLLDSALAWLEHYHFDGLRLDAVHELIDASAVHYLEQLASEVGILSGVLGRRLVLVAETDRNDPRYVRPFALGGYGLDAHWEDDLHHAIHVTLTGESGGYYEDFTPVADVVEAMQGGYVFQGRWSPARGRSHGRPPDGVDGSQLVVGIQNHDQVGNRAKGDRLAHTVGVERQMVGATLLLASPFTPMLFQGEEWAASSPFPYFADHEPDLAEAVRKGRLEEFAAFGWSPDDVPDPEDAATFAAATLDWAELDGDPHARVLDWYRRLVRLRRTEPDLSNGRWWEVEAAVAPSSDALALRRGTIVVVANFAEHPRTLALPGIEPTGPAQLLLSSSGRDVAGEGTVDVAPLSAAVLRSS